jgi:glyoxylate reductase
VIVTRHLMPEVEARMRELFDVVLNASDVPLTREQLVKAMKDCDVLVPTVTDRIDADRQFRCWHRTYRPACRRRAQNPRHQHPGRLHR